MITPGAIDLTMDGGNPQVLFAAMWQAQRYPWKLVDGGNDSGIWRSTDGGDTWTKLTTGLPVPPIGRISIAAAPSNPEHVYALVETRRGNGLLFASDDLGDHWQKVSDDYAIDVRPFYFHMYTFHLKTRTGCISPRFTSWNQTTAVTQRIPSTMMCMWTITLSGRTRLIQTV